MSNTIAFLCHPYHRGGVTSWMVNAALESSKQGYKTFFITVDPQQAFISSGGRATLVELLGNQFPILIINQKVDYLFELGTDDYRAFIYANLIKNNVPYGTAIIVSDDASVWRGAALVANQYPFVAVIHSSLDPGYYNLTGQYQKHLSVITAVSNRTKENLYKKVPGLQLDAAVIPCGIPLNDYLSPTVSGGSGTRVNIVWMGRLEEISKRVSDIPKIALKMREHGIPFHIKVIGHGDSTSILSEAIKNNQLDQQIEQVGWQENDYIINAYKQADILLQTSNYEGMSIAVMEALASGCGVVSTRVSGVEDYEHSQYANNSMLLYEIGNIDEAVEKIMQLTQIDKQQRRVAAQTFAQEVFSITSCMNHYFQAINNAQLQSPLDISQPKLLLILKSVILAVARKSKYVIFSKLKK